jgi:hypothetical protein
MYICVYISYYFFIWSTYTYTSNICTPEPRQITSGLMVFIHTTESKETYTPQCHKSTHNRYTDEHCLFYQYILKSWKQINFRSCFLAWKEESLFLMNTSQRMKSELAPVFQFVLSFFLSVYSFFPLCLKIRSSQTLETFTDRSPLRTNSVSRTFFSVFVWYLKTRFSKYTALLHCHGSQLPIEVMPHVRDPALKF